MRNIKLWFIGAVGIWILLAGSVLAVSRVAPKIQNDSVTTTSPNQVCIVTINNSQYDVSRLRQTHSGGDVFTCGTDMTDVFYSMHNNALLNNQMQQYLVK